MITRRPLRQNIAIAMAVGFFWLICILFVALVGFGFSVAANTAHSGSQARFQQPMHYPAPVAAPLVDEDYGGRMVAMVDGREVALPTLKTDYDVDVRGDLVEVQVTQRFENPGDVPLDATYQFPLHEDAAVYAMTMRVGDEVVRAEIQERDEAQRTFEEAKIEGRAAVLTEQHRPNLFQQSVANLMPGVPVEVVLNYVHAASRRDGRYHITLPLVVGPRYNPGAGAANALAGDDMGLPQHAPVQQIDAPATLDESRVGIEVRIDAGMPLAAVESATHEVDVKRLGQTDARVELARGRALDNRHFELSYGVYATKPTAGLLADFDPAQQRGYFSVLIEPPANAGHDLATPREMVFVLDCSGSMSGQPMEASKAFMRKSLRGLRATDTFRIIRFSDEANEYSREPIAATPANIEDALEYVDDLHGSGGTHMRSGIEQALRVPVPAGSIRLVTFMTDGYIGNEFEITTLLRSEVGDARLFAIGVGAGVNRFLIEEMARTGRGFARYIDPTADVDAVASELAERLETPVLTDIELRATDAGIEQVAPRLIPDLFAGQSVRITGSYTRPGAHTIIVRGKVNGRRIEIPLEVDLPSEPTDGDAVRLTWARAQIDERMHALSTPLELRAQAKNDDELKSEVTRLGLNYSLMTQWTSFVAVSERVVNDEPGANAAGEVPVSQVAGVGETAYRARFGGGATPEPGIIGGLLMTLLAAGAARRRRED